MMVQTEIGLLPEDWEVKRIGDFFDFKNGLNKGKEFFGYGIPIVNYTDVYKNRSLRTKDIKGKVDLSREEINRYRTKRGDVFFTRTSETPEEVGFASVLLDDIQDCVFSGFVLRARPKNDRLHPEYCGYSFTTKNVRSSIIASCSYTTRALTNGTLLSAIQIPVPSTTEQQNIASALSSIDKLIDDLGRTILKKQRIREGAMEELLSGKKRLPGFTEEWVEKKIGDIGKTYSGLTGKTKEDFGHGDAKYITFLNVLNNAILDISIFEAVDVRPNEKQNAACYGDLFFNTSSETPEDVGTCACLNTEVPNLHLNSFCFGYRLNDEEVYGNFLAYFFRTKAGRDIMYSLAQGATRYNLSREYFNEIKIKMPPTIKEQQSISYVFEAMTDEISLLESERAKYEQIRSGMMEELLTGKKRLKQSE